jgi:MFS family permease
MDAIMNSQPSAFNKALSFWKRQENDWKITVARTSLDRFGYQIILPYLSIYIVALGATKTQLGLLNSIGLILAGLLGPFTGWIIDRSGPKKVYLVGILLLVIAYLTYGLSQNWLICILAISIYYIGNGTSIHSCATICGNCLVNRDRATGMMICETAAAGLLGMAGPMIGAFLVVRFGGVNVAGIRPLFFVAAGIAVVTFLLVLTRLSNQKWAGTTQSGFSMLKNSLSILKGSRNKKKWIVIGALSQLPVGMIIPFTQVFANEQKGASEFILGGMVTGAAVASIVFGLFAGTMADRVGRKRALYVLIPLFWAANLMLIWAPSPFFLIISGILMGSYYIAGPIGAAIERELVPAEQMGRWIGINRFVKAICGASMALMAGIIWDKMGPQYIFIIFVGLDLIIRIPLLISLPETLHYDTVPKA